MKYLLLIFTLSLLTLACQPKIETNEPLEDNSQTLNDTLTKNLQSAFEKGAIIGLAVSVVDGEKRIYDQGFGFADIGFTQDYTSNTTQNIASISKTLIGISLLKAQEQGHLNLDDPINKYLPFEINNPHYPEIPILVKHLAYHSSSIIDVDEVYSKSYVLKKSTHAENEGVYDWFNKPETNIPLIDFLKNSLTLNGKWYTKEMFANTKPGAIREYSNIGSALCAQIIEIATGRDYQSFTKEYILQALKMSSSGWSDEDIDTTNRSRLFANKEMMIAEYSLITYADGGFITSSNDLSLFLIELMQGYKGEGTLLSKESYEILFEKKRFPNIEKEDAFGIFIEFTSEFIRIQENVIGHNGSDPGVMTGMYFNPKTETGKILLVNTDSDFDENFWPEVVEIWNALIKYEAEFDRQKANR